MSGGGHGGRWYRRRIAARPAVPAPTTTPRLRVRRGARRLLASLLAAGLLGACASGDGLPGAPDALLSALEAMPATAVERGLFWTDLGASREVRDAASAELAATLHLDDLTAVLSSGGPPATVLLGRFSAAAVAETARAAGFRPGDGEGWTVLTASDDTFVPALAVRDGVLLAGAIAEVEALVAGAPTAADVGWVARLRRAAGQDAAAVALAPAPDPTLAEHVRRSGSTAGALLQQAGVSRPLGSYEGFLISGPPDGTGGPGAVAIALREGVDGQEMASALAVRLSTSGMVGEPTRRLADQLEPGGARLHESAAVVRLPVAWETFDAAALQRDVESQSLAFLVPDG
jgi:hypothetical protein